MNTTSKNQLRASCTAHCGSAFHPPLHFPQYPRTGYRSIHGFQSPSETCSSQLQMDQRPKVHLEVTFLTRVMHSLIETTCYFGMPQNGPRGAP